MMRILISMGDPSGIGTEIIIKSLDKIRSKSVPVIVGDFSVFQKTMEMLSFRPSFNLCKYMEGKPGDVEFVDLGILKDVEYGKVSAEYGYASYQYIIEALKRISLGEVQALVTCPISKKSLQMANIPFRGHTELLAQVSNTTDFVMMLLNRRIRVALVTTHIPLKDVPSLITTENVLKTVYITERSLRELFGIENPKIKVLGLNPHAGEGGTIGTEEERIVEAISEAKDMGMEVSGPYPADSAFTDMDCDAYIAMYHDQGLIPVKTIDFKRTVNLTLGIPFIRTSPGHGTAPEIAGLGVADPESFIEAYRLAERLSKVKMRHGWMRDNVHPTFSEGSY